MKSPAEYREELQVPEKSGAVSPITTLTIDETIRGARYQGSFTFEVPTIADQILIGQLKNKYLPDGSKADLQSATLVEQICYLEVCLKDDKPSWWKPMEFRESDLIAILYAKGVAYANSFLGRGEDGEAADSRDGEGDRRGGSPDDEGSVESGVPGPDERPPTVIAHSKRTG